MTKHTNQTVEKVAELRGRAAAIGAQIQRDVELLLEVHRELFEALTGLRQVPDEPPPRPAPERRILRIAELSKTVGLARSSIWRLQKEGRFPAPYRISTKAVGWKSTDIDEWLRTLGAAAVPIHP